MIKHKTRRLFPAVMALVITASLGIAVLPAQPVQAAVTPMVSAGWFHTVALRSNGTAVAVGDNGYGKCNVSSWTGITQVSAGYDHTLGLKSDGKVVAVGDDSYHQCYVSYWAGITQVDAGALHSVGLRSIGKVLAEGSNDYRQCDVSSWTGITQVAAGALHTVGLKSNGTVVAVGAGGYGQCDVGSWTGITQVSAGSDHTLGLKSNGTVVAVGTNSRGQCNVGSWTGITQVSAGEAHSVGLKSDGTVVAVGYNSYGQCNVGSWTGITQVAAGALYTVGLKSNGTVVAVGANDYGQCNVGSWDASVTTNAASGLGAGSATLNMSYTLGLYIPVDVSFAYKKTADSTWTNTSWVSKSADGGHAEPLTGLDSNTAYDFKAQLKYGTTVIEGSTFHFTTGKTFPTVTTQAASGVGLDSATLNMSYIIGDYNPVDVRFTYKKSSDSTWIYTSWVSKTADGSYSEPISGLSINTQYDFKAQLKYDSTEIEGSTLTFTTGKTSPTVTTQAASGVGLDSAALNMTYTPGDYNPVDVRFAYKKSDDPAWTNTPWASRSEAGTHAVSLTGLSPGTQYDFRAELRYDIITIQGNILQFTTVNPFIGTRQPSSSASGTASTTQAPVSLPNVIVQSASLSAARVAPGTPIEITATLVNRGTINGRTAIRLYVNGQEEAVQGVTLESGKSRDISFTTVQDRPGTYTVYVGGVQAGSFTVDEYFNPNIILFISMALIFIALILGIMYVWRRRQQEY